VVAAVAAAAATEHGAHRVQARAMSFGAWPFFLRRPKARPGVDLGQA